VFWEFLTDWNFLGVVQRRGADVSVPKIGSRGEVFVFGGIYGFYAVLRRDLIWGNWELGFFWGLGGVPRGSIEEGDQLMFTLCFLGEFWVLIEGWWFNLGSCKARSLMKGEVGAVENSREGFL
jgi:hypothetical protein